MYCVDHLKSIGGVTADLDQDPKMQQSQKHLQKRKTRARLHPKRKHAVRLPVAAAAVVAVVAAAAVIVILTTKRKLPTGNGKAQSQKRLKLKRQCVSSEQHHQCMHLQHTA